MMKKCVLLLTLCLLLAVPALADSPRVVDRAGALTSAESSPRMRSISACSARASSRRALLALTALMGSMKKVPPLEDTSCTRPGTADLLSALTGTT